MAAGASSPGEAPEPRPVSPPPAPSGRASNALFDESWLGGKPLDAPVHPVPREQGTPFTRSDHLPPDAVALDLPRTKAPFADAEPVEEAPALSPDARKRAGSIFDESWFGKQDGASARPSEVSPPPPLSPPPPVVTSEPRRPSPFDEPVAEIKRQPIAETPPPPPVAPPPPPVIARPVVETAAASSAAASPEAARAMLLAFLEGAGLDPTQVRADDPEALMRELGRRFRAMSQGLVRLLEIRARLKQESGLERTRVAASGNNPLKLTASGREAALWLVQPRGEGYLEPLPAIAATVQDLEAFMPELLSAMQGALRRLVGRFDPVLLEQELADAGLLELLAAGGRKARCWELLKERYGEIAAEAEARFLREVGVDLGRPHRPKERG